ncbi:hypothetical protein HDK77DRAFT_502406 [Phyllosticta capitalensis]
MARKSRACRPPNRAQSSLKSRSRSSPPKASLLDMPNELQSMIMAQVDTRHALFNIALTCKHLNTIVEPYLYSNIVIKHCYQQATVFNTIKAKPNLAKHVVGLYVCRGSKENYDMRMEDRAYEREPRDCDLLPLFPNIQEFYFKSYDCYLDRFNDIFARAAKGEILRKLKTCHLFPVVNESIVDQNEWRTDVQSYEAVLKHPGLEALRLINLNIGPSMQPSDRPFTSLQRLEIFCSSLNIDGLRNVLTYPRSLKELLIMPNSGYDEMEEDWGAPDFTADMLEPVKDSLVKLVITEGITGTSQEPMKLCRMVALRHMSVVENCLFGKSVQQDYEDVTFEMLRTSFPPNLQVWELQCYPGDVMRTINPVLAHKDEICPNLERISVSELLRDEVLMDDLMRFARAGIAITFDIRYEKVSNPRDDTDDDDGEVLQRPITISSEGLCLATSYIDNQTIQRLSTKELDYSVEHCFCSHCDRLPHHRRLNGHGLDL